MKTINITYSGYGLPIITSDSVIDSEIDRLYKDYMRNYGKRIARGERYRKYMALDVNEVHTITKTKLIPERSGQPIISHMVRLGGPFEEVGGTDEVIGREDQRLGSDNK